MDILKVETEKDNINLNLNIEPELTVVNDDALLGAELLIDPSKNNSESNNSESNTVVNEDINLFQNNKVNDIGADPIMKTIDTSDNNQSLEYVPIHTMSQNDIKNEKIDLIYKFKKLENQGIDTTMNYNMNSGLDEMRNEYIKLKKQRELENSVKFQRKMLMAIITAIEFLNGRFDPFDLKLNGWSESVNENIYDYDEIFEELHEKYGGGTEMAPEIRLILMLGGSAFMFHLTNTMLKSAMPSMDKLFEQNPDMMNKFASAAKGNPNKSGGKPQMPSGLESMMGGMMNNMMGGMMGGGMPGMASQSGFRKEPPVKKMSGPENIDDIVNDMKIDDLDLDDISIASSESNTSKSGGISLDI
tara:strand:+ start:1536 stop:2612 length:1077 start_codon:yes stop_codon:yes gene_type:complete